VIDDDLEIPLRCLFCKVPLQAAEDSSFHAGDLIRCLSCGEDSEYESVLEVAKEEAQDNVQRLLDKEMSKLAKKLFK